MGYFFWLSIGLVIVTLGYYVVFASIIYYWHEKWATVVVVPLLYTFHFFVKAFLVTCLLALIIQFAPDIISLFYK